MPNPAPADATPLAVPLPADAPAGVYIHVPFCRHICPYCDFNTYAGQESLIPAYVDALVAEIQLASARTPGNDAPTLFFGGGTPSLLTPGQIARVIEAARNYLGLRDDAEITLEANPEGLTVDALRETRLDGVNRLSLGVQSQRRAGLRVLGRRHGGLQAEAALRAAREAGFENVSLDFIFGWPGQSLDDWEADLRTLLDWSPEHVSLYSLIVEPGTPMADAVKRGILSPVDDDAVADLYERAVDLLGAAGWDHYEIANWARETRYRSRHNQLYWQIGSYHGIGAGAHGTIGNVRTSNHLLPAKHIAAIRAGALPVAVSETLSPETAMGETMMLGLRLLVDGVSAAAFAARHGIGLSERYAAEIDRFTALGLLEWRGERLRLTPRGALLANDVCAAFLS